MQLGFFAVALNAFLNEKNELVMENIVDGLSTKLFPTRVELFLCHAMIGNSMTEPGDYEYVFSMAMEGNDERTRWGYGVWTKPEDDLSKPVLPVVQKFITPVTFQFGEPGLYTITVELGTSSKSHSFYLVDFS